MKPQLYKTKPWREFCYQDLWAIFGLGGGEHLDPFSICSWSDLDPIRICSWSDFDPIWSELSWELGTWDGELLAQETPKLSGTGTSIFISWKSKTICFGFSHFQCTFIFKYGLHQNVDVLFGKSPDSSNLISLISWESFIYQSLAAANFLMF
jgi:hypothetical protein